MKIVPIEKNRAVVVLAAGASSRMGKPKQLLMYKGKTILQRIVEIAEKAEVDRVFAVLGANADAIRAGLELKKEDILLNESWQEGIASSIRTGLKGALLQCPHIRELAFVVGDQPYLTTQVINDLFALRVQTDMPIAACRYAGAIGTPAVFHQDIFPALNALKGDEGAKKIISSRMDHAGFLDFPEGVADVDTEADYIALLRNEDPC